MKEKILQLLNENNYISGEKIGKKLGVTRTAVWKQIQNLEKAGYQIESIKNKGYRIIKRPDIPIETEVKQNLNTRIIGRKVYYYPEITSTNTIAKQKAMEKTTEGTIIIADKQTKGRGRKNRTWVSLWGGLWFSIILYPDLPPERGMAVTMTASVSLAQAIEETTGIKPVIKWPNDLLINNKKVCGILTELDAEIDKINYVIVGIGINVNNEIKDDLKSIATSLKEITGSSLHRVKLLRTILKYFDKNYLHIDNPSYIRKQWLSYSKIIGKKMMITEGENKSIGVVQDVDESGCLIMNSDGKLKRIVSGDLSFL